MNGSTGKLWHAARFVGLKSKSPTSFELFLHEKASPMAKFRIERLEDRIVPSSLCGYHCGSSRKGSSKKGSSKCGSSKKGSSKKGSSKCGSSKKGSSKKGKKCK